MINLSELSSDNFDSVEPQYRETGKALPVIHSVITGSQKGKIFVATEDDPRSAFVIHKFGFVTVVGKQDDRAFNYSVLEMLTRPGTIHREYALWYWPDESIKEQIKACNPLNWQVRTRVRLARKAFSPAYNQMDANCRPITKGILQESEYLGVQIQSRFWDSADHFLENGFGVAVFEQGRPVSVCYTAAQVDSKAEVDIFTAEEYRGKGLGQKALSAFLRIADAEGIVAMWDCFEANRASLLMAQKNGFVDIAAYEFLTFNTPLITAAPQSENK